MHKIQKMNKYNPTIHHRKSIRLKVHDYAGGGLYFVTICAHRNAGKIFASEDVRKMVAREFGEGRHGCRPYRDAEAESLWLPHVTPGGMLDRLVRELDVKGK